jgi:hypothetical protein
MMSEMKVHDGDTCMHFTALVTQYGVDFVLTNKIEQHFGEPLSVV